MVQTELQEFLLHFSLLMMKTSLAFGRSRKAVLTCLLCPILFVAFVWWFGGLHDAMAEDCNRPGTIHEMTTTERCHGTNCISVGYAIIGDKNDEESWSWIDEVMKKTSTLNGMIFH